MDFIAQLKNKIKIGVIMLNKLLLKYIEVKNFGTKLALEDHKFLEMNAENYQ